MVVQGITLKIKSLAYLHTLLSFRLPSLATAHLADQDISLEEVKKEMGILTPFLVEPKSTVRHESIRDAWGDVWEKIGKDLVSPISREYLALRVSRTLRLVLSSLFDC